MIKRSTEPILPPPPGAWKKRKHKQDHETHPSWLMGVELLNSYNEWVCEVLMPVAFQWIYEHYDEVYAVIPNEKNHDDVGVVIAAAFDIVKKQDSYASWEKATEQYEKDVANGTFDPSSINPVWTAIVKQIREATHHAFDREASVLKDTIRAEPYK